MYARSGNPYFWRVELDQEQPVVCTYERDPASGDNANTGIHRDKGTMKHPFAVDLDLTEANARGVFLHCGSSGGVDLNHA